MLIKNSNLKKVCYLSALIKMLLAEFFISCAVFLVPAQNIIPEVVYQNANTSDQDDMCIWVNLLDNSQSTLIASDKVSNRIFVYNLDGSLLQNISVTGVPGNVDVRYNFPLAGEFIDLVGYNDITNSSLRFYKVDRTTRQLSFINSFKSGTSYGFALYKSPVSGKYYAFSSSTTSVIEQYELCDNNGMINGILLRRMNNGINETEGMVCDDEGGILFAANEDGGIYKYNAEPTVDIIARLDAETGDESGWTVSEINTGNSFEAETEAKSNGNYGYKILYGPNGFECEKYYITSDRSEAYFRYNYYIPNDWVCQSGFTQVFMGGIESGQSGNLLVGLIFLTSTSTRKINSFRIGSTQLGNFDITNSNYWSPDNWHSIEFRYKRETSSNGGIQCWIDKDLVVNDMNNTITYYANTFSVGPWVDWGGGFGNGKYVYIDDVIANVSPTGQLIAVVGQNGLAADVEGLTIYYLPQGEGYLLASSQGNNRFYVYNRKSPHDYIKYFTVSGVLQTDGIDVCNLNLGGQFSQGIFVCHDGIQSPYVVRGNQWEDIGLTINTSHWPLPVELVYFTGRIVNDEIILEWKTETEVSNYGFEVEKKIDSSWDRIGFVPGNGNSNSPRIYEFTDKQIFDKNIYRLKQIDTDGQYEYSNETEINCTIDGYELSDNYPNPFNPSTTIKFSVPKETIVNIGIYNILGELISTLVNEELKPGYYEYEFNASDLATGIYLYRINAGDFAETKKMILLK